MQLLLAGLVSGVAVGALYGLLGFAIVMLLKATGTANFAQGALATLGAFLVYELVQRAGLPFWQAFLLVGPVMALVGAGLYALAMRPNDDADHLNGIIRTLALSLLIVGAINREWAAGQPFAFPTVISGNAAFVLGGVTVSWLTVGTVGVACLLALFFAWFFHRTAVGLQFLALAERADISLLLGVRTRQLTATAWGMAALISLVTGVLVAPRTLLSSDMMDFYLLYAFTAAVIGGLTSTWGVFVGGVLVGCVDNLCTIYSGPDFGVVAVFLLLIAVLLLKPSGLFGDRSLVERL